MITDYPQFFTATNLCWKPLLQPDRHKDIIIRSLRFMVEDNRLLLYGFVIMPNHVHLVWQRSSEYLQWEIQRDFLKFTAQRLKYNLSLYAPDDLLQYRVNAKDRQYQFWERNPLSVEIWSRETMIQKLQYLHQNPVRAGLCEAAEKYKYSSALFYLTGKDNWGFLTHFMD
jgi:putative transposase